MHFASRSRLLTLIAFVTACGARTELPVANSGGAEGDGGSGGEGGAPAPSCVLTQLAGEIVLVGGEDAPQRSPALEDIDGSAVFLTHIAAPSFSTDERLGRGIFNWGDPWPPTVSFDVGGPACRRFEAYGSLALIADPAGTPFLASVSSADPLLQLAVGETTPVFFDATTPVMFGGFTIAADSQLYLVVPTADFDFDFRLEWGCGSTPVRADAIRSGESYLVAMTSGTDFGGCGIPGGAGPATRLQIARFTTSFEDELLYEVDLGQSLASLALAPRSGGAWLALREEGQGADTTIDVYRLDESGAPIGAPTVIDPHGPAGAFSAGQMGDRLAVAYHDGVTNHMTIQIVEASGALGATGVLNSPENGESSVVGKDDTVLLAYTTPGTPSQVRVARFECVLP